MGETPSRIRAEPECPGRYDKPTRNDHVSKVGFTLLGTAPGNLTMHLRTWPSSGVGFDSAGKMFENVDTTSTQQYPPLMRFSCIILSKD